MLYMGSSTVEHTKSDVAHTCECVSCWDSIWLTRNWFTLLPTHLYLISQHILYAQNPSASLFMTTLLSMCDPLGTIIGGWLFMYVYPCQHKCMGSGPTCKVTLRFAIVEVLACVYNHDCTRPLKTYIHDRKKHWWDLHKILIVFAQTAIWL